MISVNTLSPLMTVHRRTLRLMGNIFEIDIVTDDESQVAGDIDKAASEIMRIEKLLSPFYEDSQINVINRFAGLQPVKVDAEIFKLIDRAVQISGLVDGAFDIIYSPKNAVLVIDVDDNENAAAGGANYRNIITDRKEQTIFLNQKGIRISLGASGFAYAADRVKYILQLQGVYSGCVSVSGTQVSWGYQPGGEPWWFSGLETVANNAINNKKLNVSNMAVSRNHYSEKLVVMAGAMPRQIGDDVLTLITDVKNVTVIAPTAEFAQSIATTIINTGLVEGLKLIDQLNQVACIITDYNHKIYTSKSINLL